MFDSSRQYEILVRPLGRNPADEYYHNGSIWIEGREGNAYTIELKNHSLNRALFILSVDGLDVLEGKPAGIDSQGYVLSPNESINIPGWRINQTEAAEFFFSRKRDSYVNNIGGTTTNTGVIGVMVFSEYYEALQPFQIATYYNGNPTNYNSRQYDSSSPSSIGYDSNYTANNLSLSTPLTVASVNAAVANIPMNAASSAEVKTSSGVINQLYVSQEVGTGVGSATDWQTQITQFRRMNPSQPDTIMALYYNTARNLEKMGIKLRRKHDVQYKADPFPAYSNSSQAQGCPIPKNWSR